MCTRSNEKGAPTSGAVSEADPPTLPHLKRRAENVCGLVPVSCGSVPATPSTEAPWFRPPDGVRLSGARGRSLSEPQTQLGARRSCAGRTYASPE